MAADSKFWVPNEAKIEAAGYKYCIQYLYPASVEICSEFNLSAKYATVPCVQREIGDADLVAAWRRDESRRHIRAYYDFASSLDHARTYSTYAMSSGSSAAR